MDNSTYKNIGIVGCGHIGMDDEYVKTKEMREWINTFICTDTHSQETTANQEDVLIKAKQKHELKYPSEKIAIIAINLQKINPQEIDKSVLEDMRKEFEAKNISFDNMESLITQTNHQPFYATLRPSKHKKTNKKKRK